MKIAIVNDILCGVGGAERVFQYMCEEFIEADVYTLAFNPSRCDSYFSSIKIKTTWLNPIIRSTKAYKVLFPIATYAIEALDLREYDCVITASATVAKYVNVQRGIHICYCFMPTRALWQFDQYFNGDIISKFTNIFLPYLRKRDYNAAQRVNKFIAISNSSKKYIKDYYNRDSTVINCPIDLSKFTPSGNKKNHYLIVSRLEHWKRIDYAIEAFNLLKLPLRIIGTGSEEEILRKMAAPNISFLGEVDDEALVREYREALAVIFTPFIEYGLIPLEANACGTPVICLKSGGTSETMIGLDSNEAPTAVFYYEQTADALIQAIRTFENLTFNTNHLVRHASNWDVPSFRFKIRKAFEKIMKNSDVEII